VATDTNKRFAAMMLFQFRTVKNGITNQRRVCEERIVLFEAFSAKQALSLAKKRGRKEEFSYLDNDAEVFFEFIGIKELLELISLEKDEVWWHLTEKVMPMENRHKLIPEESQLDALKVTVSRKRGKLSVPGKR
jgi:hypothetical protein